jgi:glycosyltransferase involved in cell wall biosynthesis
MSGRAGLPSRAREAGQAGTVPRAGMLALTARLTGIVCLVTALFFRTPLWCWMGSLIFVYVCVVHRGIRVTFERRVEAVPELPESDLPGPNLPIVIPARNEAEGIETTVRSLASGSIKEMLEIIVVNDNSTDETQAILRALSRELPRLKVIDAPLPPAGWMGKTHALGLGAKKAGGTAEWILFLDARTRLNAGVAKAAAAFAEKENLDLLGCVPRFEGVTLFERWITLFFLRGIFQTLFPEEDDLAKSRPAGAIGAFLLARRELYEKAGGHAAIKGERYDDLALASLFKSVGGRVGVVRAGSRVTLRRYSGVADARARTIRALRFGSQDSLVSLLSGIALEALLYVMPLFAAVGMGAALLIFRVVTGAELVFIFVGLAAYLTAWRALRFDSSLCDAGEWTCATHPIAALIRIFFRTEAIWQIVRRRPVSWRGRTL